MPQVRALESLKQLCISNVARNIDFWCRDYVENWMHIEESCIHILGPFSAVPSCLLESIIEDLNIQGNIRSHHLHVLIVEHLQKFCLQRKTGNINGTLKILAKRCKVLKNLTLSNYVKISRQVLNQAITEFHKLEVINFSYCNIYDQSLSVISTHCKNLKNLNVMGTNITDFGIFSLFQEIEENFIDFPVDPCQRNALPLEILDLRDTCVTTDCITAALINLPQLIFLRSDYVLTSLAKICKSKRESMPSLLLRNIDHEVSGLEGFNSETMTKVLQMCPNAHELSFFVDKYFCSHLLQLIDLNCITELQLDARTFEPQISFLSYVCPILMVKGRTIKCLRLSKFSSVDIPLIAIHCPRIESLCLYISTFRNSRSPSGATFTHLKNLEVHSLCVDSLPTNSCSHLNKSNLVHLLSSVCLESVYLSFQPDLIDGLISHIITKNNFSFLKTLSFEDCHEITAKSVWRFLMLKNPMDNLALRDCESITLRDYNAFQKYIKESGFNIKLLYV